MGCPRKGKGSIFDKNWNGKKIVIGKVLGLSKGWGQGVAFNDYFRVVRKEICVKNGKMVINYVGNSHFGWVKVYGRKDIVFIRRCIFVSNLAQKSDRNANRMSLTLFYSRCGFVLGGPNFFSVVG